MRLCLYRIVWKIAICVINIYLDIIRFKLCTRFDKPCSDVSVFLVAYVYSRSACCHFCTDSLSTYSMHCQPLLPCICSFVIFMPAVPCHRNKSLYKVILLRVILCSQSWRKIKCNGKNKKKKQYCCQCKKERFLAQFSPRGLLFRPCLV